MKKIGFFLTILFLTNQVKSQDASYQTISYEEIRGSSNIKQINNFSNGDLALIGENTPQGSKKKNIFIIRTNPQGSIIWKKEFYSDRILAINDFLIDSLNNIIIAAEQYEEGNKESLFLLGLDSNGDILFSNHFNEGNGEVEAYDITIEETGGFLITGFCKLPTIVSNSFFKMTKEDQFLYLLKVNPKGEKIWSRYIKEDYYEGSGKKIIIDNNSTINIFSNNHKNNKENCIKLIVSQNNKIFQEYKLATNKNTILSDAIYHKNHFYLTGLILNKNNKENYYDIFLMKLNNDHQTVFSKIIKTNYNDWVTGIDIKRENDNIILFGQLNTGNGKNLYLIEFDQEGFFISCKMSNQEQESISLMNGKNTKHGIFLAGSDRGKKRAGIILNINNLTSSKNPFTINKASLTLHKLREGNYINLNNIETIDPVNLKEWKY